MHTNMNFPAPLSVLGFVAGFGGLILSSLVITVSAAIRKTKFAKTMLRLIAFGAVAYFALLLGFSLVSRQVVLARGEEKYFCEIDCHLAYSVVETKPVMEAGTKLLAVTLRTRFDATTISPNRPKETPLMPNARVFYLVDSEGRRYDMVSTTGTPLMTPLKPGDSYLTTLTFRQPQQTQPLRLLISLPGWEDHFLIGDENSLLHRKTYLAL
jgi:hypothetical protein